MHEPYSRSRILSQGHKCDKFDPDLIDRTLASLQVSEMALAYCSADEAEGVAYDQTEPNYGVTYGIKALSEDFLEQCRHPPKLSGLHLPRVSALCAHACF
jgi:secreted Zn-dependent insulinase-like peptidase